MARLKTYDPKFQSTLPRGSDGYKLAVLLTQVTFQSTLPRGSDSPALSRQHACQRISIHAPSRERL